MVCETKTNPLATFNIETDCYTPYEQLYEKTLAFVAFECAKPEEQMNKGC